MFPFQHFIICHSSTYTYFLLKSRTYLSCSVASSVYASVSYHLSSPYFMVLCRLLLLLNIFVPLFPSPVLLFLHLFVRLYFSFLRSSLSLSLSFFLCFSVSLSLSLSLSLILRVPFSLSFFLCFSLSPSN